MGYSVGLEDLKHPITLTKCVVAEFLGTMFLVIIGCGTASVASNDYSTKAIKHFSYTDENSLETLLQVSLAFGLGVMSIACFTGHISGGLTISTF